jgi:hypothetical protein
VALGACRPAPEKGGQRPTLDAGRGRGDLFEELDVLSGGLGVSYSHILEIFNGRSKKKYYSKEINIIAAQTEVSNTFPSLQLYECFPCQA